MTPAPGPPRPARYSGPKFNIVLHEPEIPNNTGNIGRTCVATGCSLHLIEPLGFDTDEKALRRAGLDYWERLAPIHYPSTRDYFETARPAREKMWLFTTKTDRPFWDVDFLPGDHMIFGKETAGLPPAMLEEYDDRLVTLPMVPGERSLNVATTVCAAIYEGLRQLDVAGYLRQTEDGRLIWARNRPGMPLQ